jgi:hypothetical protein
MTLHNYELRDPAALIEEIADAVDLVEDTAYVALVHHPSTRQRLLGVRRLDLPALVDDDDDISDDLCTVARSFGIGWHGRSPEHLLMTVVVRPGRCVFGPNEGVWLRGWRYSNHCESMYTGELMLVTEHGWVDLMSDAAGSRPALVIGVPRTPARRSPQR